MILLDTDHVSLLQRGGPLGDRIRARLRLLGLAVHPPTTIISYEEQLRGWISELAKAKKLTLQIELYARLRTNLEYFCATDIADFDAAAATAYQQLLGAKIRIGTMDLKIAAIALANDATFWSRNLRHFSRIPNLKVLDATIPQ
jgi:tRNA(fMet)-specific endonuclease VapC